MHLANQRTGKPDKLSQDAHSQTTYPRIQWENTLDKKEGYRTPGGRSQEAWQRGMQVQKQEHMTTHAAGS